MMRQARTPSPSSTAPVRSGGWGVESVSPTNWTLLIGRSVWSALLLILVGTVLFGQVAYSQEPTSASEPWTYGPIGTIVAPHGAGVVLTNVATGDEQLMAVLPPVGVSGHAAWSPDRTRLAISRFGRQPGERVGGSDILVPAARRCPLLHMTKMERCSARQPGCQIALASTTITCRHPVEQPAPR
jgi:hypothetical protein